MFICRWLAVEYNLHSFGRSAFFIIVLVYFARSR